MKYKCTLVIDGNWLLMSRFFMLRETFRKELGEENLIRSSEGLADLMAQSISLTLRQFQDNVTNVILVSDNRSWRKEYPIPKCISNETYKGTRSQDSEYNWEYVFKSINILSERFKNLNITTSNAYGVEGDDWCWWWSRKLNAEGINVILWTVDEDVKQLVQVDSDTDAWTAWYEKGTGLVFNETVSEEKEPDDDLDFFMTPIIPKKVNIDKLKKVTKISYVNPITIINKKIYVGDAGDNVLPVFTYIKGKKNYKATQKDWEKLIDFNKDSYTNKEWKEILNDLYDEIYDKKNPSLGKNVSTKSDFIEHAIYNRKMVWLNESQIPENVQSQMTSAEYSEIPEDLMHDLRYNWKVIGEKLDSNNVEQLFEDLPEF